MHIEFLVEEQSMEVALNTLVPRIVGEVPSFNVRVFQGKQDLLKELPNRLRGYRQWLPHDWRIVVLIDEDREDCHVLKERLEGIARDAGFVTRTSASPGQRFYVVNRIVIEELEAWFLGDVDAVLGAFPRVPRTFHRRRGLREPDAIAGGTCEALERLLKRAGYYAGGMPKIEAARRISACMDPQRNRSRSFCLFRETLRELT